MNETAMQQKQKEQRVVYLIALLSAFITYLVYFPALHHEFLDWDDGMYVYSNYFIRSFDGTFFKNAFFRLQASNWHPLTWASHAIDYSAWGLNPLGHHLTSIVLHSLNTCLVVLLTARLLKSFIHARPDTSFLSGKGVLIASAITGLLFGLHPIHVESVAWVSERKDVLCAFFYLLSILSYTRFVREWSDMDSQPPPPSSFSSRFYLLSLVFFLFSVMSKPMAITLPFILLILDWYPFRRLHRSRVFPVVFEKTPFFVLSLVLAIITVLAQQSYGAIASLTAIPLFTRVLVAFRSLIGYLYFLIYPVGLSPYYPHPFGQDVVSLSSLTFLAPFLLVAGISISCVLVLRKQKVWLAVWGHYCLTLLPVLGIVQVGSQAMADRYVYLPSIGPFLLIGIGAAWLFEGFSIRNQVSRAKKFFLLLIALVLFAALSYTTLLQLRVWENTGTLWSRVISLYPDVSLPYNNRGVYYRNTGHYRKAIRDFTRGIDLDPGNVLLFRNRARTYMTIQQFDMALSDIHNAMRISPEDWEAYSVRAEIYSVMGQYEKALADYNRVIGLNPDLPAEYNNRGNIHVRLNHPQEALRDYQQAIQLNPDPPAGYFKNLAVVYKMLGQREEALKYYREHVDLSNRK
jgi:Tfp pilus assembly protein PilF